MSPRLNPFSQLPCHDPDSSASSNASHSSQPIPTSHLTRLSLFPPPVVSTSRPSPPEAQPSPALPCPVPPERPHAPRAALLAQSHAHTCTHAQKRHNARRSTHALPCSALRAMPIFQIRFDAMRCDAMRSMHRPSQDTPISKIPWKLVCLIHKRYRRQATARTPKSSTESKEGTKKKNDANKQRVQSCMQHLRSSV